MADAVAVTGIPTRAKADRVAATMRMLFPDWTVTIDKAADGTYTVTRTPPGTEAAATAGAATPAAAAVPAVLEMAPAAAARRGKLGFLDFIASYESHGNLNARYGKVGNADDPAFTGMTVDQVLAWQEGRKYSACGKYQVIAATLRDLRGKLGLSGTELYDAALQDRLGLELLRRRGVDRFLAGGLSREDFALAVAREWAALPGVVPPHGARSVYAGDGVNHALVNVATYLAAIDRLAAEGA